MGRRLANLLMIKRKMKIEPILPEEMDYADEELNEKIIEGDFNMVGLQASLLSPLLQPSFNLSNGYPGEGLEAIDLVLMVLGLVQKERQDEELN